jgi:carbamate kinase
MEAEAARMVLADAVRRRVVLADAPKRRVDASRIANALGAEEILPAPAAGGSPVCRYVRRTAALASAQKTRG